MTPTGSRGSAFIHAAAPLRKAIRHGTSALDLPRRRHRTAARYLIALWAAQRFGSAFPHDTLIVNLIGCFAIAALMHAALTLGWPPTVRAAATIGFIGGLTTYSSFNYETMRLFEEGAPATAFVNLSVTVIGGFMAGWLGCPAKACATSLRHQASFAWATC